MIKTFKQMIIENEDEDIPISTSKKTIVTDIDGCVLDFATPCKEYIKKNYPQIQVTDSEYNMGVPPNLVGEIMDGFIHSNGLSDLNFYPNAKETINALSTKYNIIVASAIDSALLSNRRKNLSGMKYNKIFLKQSGKIMFIIKTLKPDIVIEDKPKNIKLLSQADIKVYYPKFIKYTKGMESYGEGFVSWNELKRKLLSDN